MRAAAIPHVVDRRDLGADEVEAAVRSLTVDEHAEAVRHSRGVGTLRLLPRGHRGQEGKRDGHERAQTGVEHGRVRGWSREESGVSHPGRTGCRTTLRCGAPPVNARRRSSSQPARRATTGSTLAAFRAGSHEASRPTLASTTPTPAYVAP